METTNFKIMSLSIFFQHVPVWRHGTVCQFDRDTKYQIRPILPSWIVVKTLRTIFCASCDDVPVKIKQENGQPYSLKLSIDWCHFQPLLAVFGQVPLSVIRASLKGQPKFPQKYEVKFINNFTILYLWRITYLFITLKKSTESILFYKFFVSAHHSILYCVLKGVSTARWKGI